jgi:hypothetical protein
MCWSSRTLRALGPRRHASVPRGRGGLPGAWGCGGDEGTGLDVAPPGEVLEADPVL